MAVQLQGGSRAGRMKRRPMSEINVTPLVDVMLVLLIVFMVAALVNKMKAPPATQPNQAPQTASRTPPASAPRAEGPSNPNLPVSMSEKDFIRKQVEDKWQFDIGARDASNLIVRIRFSLNPDGSLRTQPEIVDQARMFMPGQDSYRSAAESARRAVLKAAPFQLPPGDREKWAQEIILNFDPRQMLGG